MTLVLDLPTIKSTLGNLNLVDAMEKGFIAYSKGEVVVPPVGELLFDDPKGDTHIKYGYIKNSDYYVIKVASGFSENSRLGLSTSQGLMLIFSQNTGQSVAILLDDGELTNLRTAAAGALVAKYFSPKGSRRIGILGTGIQARLQLKFLLEEHQPESILVWGRSKEKAYDFCNDVASWVNVSVAQSPDEVAKKSNLIVTTTSAEQPLLFAKDIRPGTHITAVGSDTATKQELGADILKISDIVISDSISQSESRGEIFRARQEGFDSDRVVELGKALLNPGSQRTNNQQITVADLTGVAVQDIMIATQVYKAYLDTKN